ncbi:hypothetical protein ERO13_A02G074301v2, partial [Gossypium hirsutum]
MVYYSFPFFFHKAIFNLEAYSIFPPDPNECGVVPLLPGINLDQTYRYANQETLQSGIVPLPLHFQQEQSLRKETCQRSLARDVLERADILIQIIKYKLL